MKDLCICGKRIYSTLAAADSVAKDLEKKDGELMNGYECLSVPGNFHVGHTMTSGNYRLFDIPKTNMAKLKSLTHMYLVVSKKSLPLDANVINRYINTGDAIVIARALSTSCIESRSASIYDEVVNVKCKTLNLVSWASANIKEAKLRLPWIKDTHDYLQIHYTRNTPEEINAFVGYRKPVEIVKITKVDKTLSVAETVNKVKYWMITSSFVGATSTHNKMSYAYHTKKDCPYLYRKGNTDITALSDFQLNNIPNTRKRICTVCSGKASIDSKVALPVPSTVVPVIDTSEISIGNEAYVRKSTIRPVIEIKEIPVKVVPNKVMSDSHVFKDLPSLRTWLEKHSIKSGDIITIMSVGYMDK